MDISLEQHAKFRLLKPKKGQTTGNHNSPILLPYYKLICIQICYCTDNCFYLGTHRIICFIKTTIQYAALLYHVKIEFSMNNTYTYMYNTQCVLGKTHIKKRIFLVVGPLRDKGVERVNPPDH